MNRFSQSTWTPQAASSGFHTTGSGCVTSGTFSGSHQAGSPYRQGSPQFPGGTPSSGLSITVPGTGPGRTSHFLTCPGGPHGLCPGGSPGSHAPEATSTGTPGIGGIGGPGCGLAWAKPVPNPSAAAPNAPVMVVVIAIFLRFNVHPSISVCVPRQQPVGSRVTLTCGFRSPGICGGRPRRPLVYPCTPSVALQLLGSVAPMVATMRSSR
jgi:hypothetical protein